jgi:carboxymethylenebutenolidase
MEQDKRGNGIDAQMVRYASGSDQIDAYMAAPAGSEKAPAVLLVHDDEGLNDFARSAAKRLAAAGFIALAPDLFSQKGGTEKIARSDRARVANLLPLGASIQNLQKGSEFLRSNARVYSNAVSSVGFGWGGSRNFRFAANATDLHAAVIFSGSTPPDGPTDIESPILAHYGQFDFRVAGNALWTAKTFKEANKEFTYYIYPKADHFFYDEASPDYDADTANLAWNRTLQFLRRSSR